MWIVRLPLFQGGVMKILKRRIEDLTPDPSNVRDHDKRNLEAITASLKRFGQQKPIVVNTGGIVIAGNGTFEAARVLQWEEIDVVVTDLESIDQTAYAIADNRTGELSDWNESDLAKLLTEMPSDILESVGYTDKEVTKLVNTVLEPVAPEEFVSLDDDIKTDYQCPKCGYEWSGRAR
jgi:ParB-like chromosome segregation protein Spo0J